MDGVAKETGGTLDMLVNNSACTDLLPCLDVSIEEAKRVYDLNVWAPWAMLQAFAPMLVKARGCVVNNASASAYGNFAVGSASHLQ